MSQEGGETETEVLANKEVVSGKLMETGAGSGPHPHLPYR